MKTAFSFFIAAGFSTLTSISSLAACPQLTGTYDCTGEAGKSIHVELKNIDGTTYKLEDQIVIRASELGVETVKNGQDFKMITNATCRDHALDIETEMLNPTSGKFLSFVQRSYVPQPSGDVDILVTWNNSTQFESSLIRCTKKN